MSAPKRPPLPVILLANHFLDGEVVFWSGHGWSRNPQEAVVASTPSGADVLEEAGRLAFARAEVVDAALIDVSLSAAGLPVPNHFRERFKISGPSVRTDLGKQAEFTRG
jgi:hypothetical protein